MEGTKKSSLLTDNNFFLKKKDYLLPRSLTARLAKSVLPPNTTIQKDALLAMQKAATVFVSYLSSQCVLPSSPPCHISKSGNGEK